MLFSNRKWNYKVNQLINKTVDKSICNMKERPNIYFDRKKSDSYRQKYATNS